jgi:hypothetical protein
MRTASIPDRTRDIHCVPMDARELTGLRSDAGVRFVVEAVEINNSYNPPTTLLRSFLQQLSIASGHSRTAEN